MTADRRPPEPGPALRPAGGLREGAADGDVAVAGRFHSRSHQGCLDLTVGHAEATVPGRSSIRAAVAALTAGAGCMTAMQMIAPLPAVVVAVLVGTALSWLCFPRHGSMENRHG